MQDNIFNLPLEFNAMQVDFQSPNYPELNKRIRIYFFLYHIQTTHVDAWKSRKLPWRLISVEQLLELSRANKLPKEYNEQRLLGELEGYMQDLGQNSDSSLGFLDVIPLRLPSHNEFWKSYIDDTNSDELLNIFKGFVNESQAESNKFKTYEDTLRLKQSMENFNKSHRD